LENGRVVTYEFAPAIEDLLNTSKVFISLLLIDFKGVRWNSPRKPGIRFRKSGTKKEVENDLLSYLALQVGLEPTTYGLTVRRSNRLSY
jgi:hypothetical protein